MSEVQSQGSHLSEVPPRIEMNNARPAGYGLLWVVALLSLFLNALVITSLLNVRRQVGQGAADAAEAVGDLRGSSIDYTIAIEHSLPVSLTVPFNSNFTVPISVTLPISSMVSIPLNTPFGVFPINVPIRTTIPVNIQPVVPINISIPISTTVPVSLDLPIHVALDDTALGDSLAGLQTYLEDVAEDLQTFPLAASIGLE